MSAKNNFQLLAQEEEEQFPHPPPETKLGIMGNIRTWHFVTDVLELYLPRVFDIFIALVGGNTSKSEGPKNNNSDLGWNAYAYWTIVRPKPTYNPIRAEILLSSIFGIKHQWLWTE